MTHSPTSDSGARSEAAQLPLPPPEPVFADFFNAALVFRIITAEMLLELFPAKRVLASIESRDRVVEIVHATIGTLPAIIRARYDVMRFAEDIQAGVEADPQIAKRFLETIGVDYFLAKMPLADLYQVVMSTGWMLEDKPTHRGFAASLLLSLVKHEAFGTAVRTLDHITKAIGLETLMSDSVPHALRTRLLTAAYKGARRYGGQHLAEYLFDAAAGGVPFDELGEYLPVEPMARAFALYVDRLEIVKTAVERPSELPPLDHPAMAPPPFPAVPRPPVLFGDPGTPDEEPGSSKGDL